MSVGAISIVTPIAATSAIVPVAVGFAHGDRPSSVQDAGFVLAFVGVVLASREEVHEARTDTRIAAGVGLALFAALCFGSSLVGLHAAAASGGDALWGTLMLRVAGIAVAVVFVVAARTRLRGRSRELVRLSPIGFLDSIGVLAFSLASTRGLISVVSVLSSLFPVVDGGARDDPAARAAQPAPGRRRRRRDLRRSRARRRLDAGAERRHASVTHGCGFRR